MFAYKDATLLKIRIITSLHMQIWKKMVNAFSNMLQITTEETRVGYFTYEGVTLGDFLDALIDRFKQSKNYPLKTKAPAQPKFPEPWKSTFLIIELHKSLHLCQNVLCNVVIPWANMPHV